MAMKRRNRTILRKTFSSLWVGGLGLLFAYPFAWMAVSSFKENSQIFLPLKFWPEFWDLSFFQQLLSSEWFSFGKVLLNSLVISLGQSVGAVLFTSLAGFAFAKHSFRGRGLLFAACLCLIVFHPKPLYNLVSKHFFNFCIIS